METKNIEFSTIIKGFINIGIIYNPYIFGNVMRLDLKDKFIFLWQNAKGDVHYSFNLLAKDYHTTSINKLGNVLSQHFGCEIEVLNNTKEQLKKMINVTSELSKAHTDLDRYNAFSNTPQTEETSPLEDNISNNPLQILDTNSSNNSIPQQYQTSLNLQYNRFNQEQLYNGVIQLATYRLESHMNTIYVKVNELPIIHKEKFTPSIKQAFVSDGTNSNYKNKFIPTPWMISPPFLSEPNQSFIILFILFMAKRNIHQAFKILAWIADSFTTLEKLPFALVLYSKDDEYMKLFYEEIVEYLYNSFQCEKVEMESVDAKSLSENLDEKAIYHFHNITTPKILGEASYELTSKLQYKDSFKINRKNITTVGNILISSTSKYIPMINKDVRSAIVNIDSSINDLCKHININPNKNIIAQKIKKDIPDFVNIIKRLDITSLNQSYPVIDKSIDSNLITGDIDVIEVFNKLIKDKDIMPFESMITNIKSRKLVEELESDFKINRVDKAHLLDYLTLLFGKGLYTSNTALIAILRKDYSDTKEPFDNEKTHVRKGRGYYFL